MPGKHAPSSPWSFYGSLIRSAVVGAIGLGLIAAIVAVTLSSRGATDPPAAIPQVTQTPALDGSPEASPSPSEVASPTPTVSGPPGAAARISVLNATERNGLAARIRARLVDEGYRRVTSGNTDASKVTRVFYRPGARTVADAVVRLIPELGEAVPATADTPPGQVVIVLGSDFDG